MQYILTKEEFENLVPKQDLNDSEAQVKIVVDAFRNTDLCVKHQYGVNCPCDDCPIASLNIAQPAGKHFRPCPHQEFSK